MKKFFLSIFIFLFCFLALEADAKIRANISVSPNPAEIDSPVQININANDSAASILLIDLYVDGEFSREDSYDCTQGTNNPVKTCSAQFTKQFSTEGNYRISGGVLDLNGALTEIPETILTITEAGAPALTPTPGGPTINSVTPNPAPIDSTINISGPNFCSNIDFDLSRITVIFDQTAISGGASISVPPFSLTSSCNLLKVKVPSSLVPENDVKVFVQNTKGLSNTVNLSLEKALPAKENRKGSAGSRPAVSSKLNVDWPNSPLGTPLTENSGLTELVKYLYEWLISLGGLAAFIALIYAGIIYLTSAGNPTQTKNAKDHLKSAAFGLVLLFGTFIILNTINPQLTKITLPPLSPSSNIDGPNFNLSLNQEIHGCEKVEISSLKEFPKQGGIPVKVNNRSDGNPIIESIKIFGSCKVKLYGVKGCGSERDLVHVEENYDFIKEEGEESHPVTINYLRKRIPQEQPAYCVKVEEMPNIDF